MWICINTQKNQFIPSVHSSDKVSFRLPSRDWPHPFFTMPTRKISNYILVCVNLYHYVPPKLDNCICSFLRYSQFRVQRTDWPHPYFDHAQPKTFRKTFNFCAFLSKCKKWGCFIDLLLRNNWLKSCNLVGWEQRYFWPFSKIFGANVFL